MLPGVAAAPESRLRLGTEPGAPAKGAAAWDGACSPRVPGWGHRRPVGEAALLGTEVTPGTSSPNRFCLGTFGPRTDFALSWERPCHWPGLGPETGRRGGARGQGQQGAYRHLGAQSWCQPFSATCSLQLCKVPRVNTARSEPKGSQELSPGCTLGASCSACVQIRV